MSVPLGIREIPRDDAVLVWELCDPARSNPVSPATLRWMTARAGELRGELVVLRGAGGRVFCGGFDLAALAEADGPELPDAPLAEAVLALRAADATFVAALDGHAVGAGVELAAACDLRVARRGVTFAIPAARLGVVYRAEGLGLLQWCFGPSLTRRLVLLGERIDADIAEHHGALDRVVDPDAFEAALEHVIAALAAGGRDALRGNRDALRELVPAIAPAFAARHEQRRLQAFVDARARLRVGPPGGGPPLPPSAGLGLRPMAIKDDIDARQKQARRDRDEATLNIIGMLKNRVLTELKSGSGAQEDDALWLAVINSYVKQLRKSIPDFEKAGERAKAALIEVEFELKFCEQFLPSRLDEAATEALVRKLVAEHDLLAQGAKATGRLMGLLMKEHKDALDGDITKAVVGRVLAGG